MSALPAQVELLSGSLFAIGAGYLWTCLDLPSLGNATLLVNTADPSPPPITPLVSVTAKGNVWILDNGLVQVAIASNSSPIAPIPTPFQGISRNGGVFRGKTVWNATAPLVSFASQLTAAGPAFAEVLLNYTFATGVATFRYRLWPNRLGVEVAENHSVDINAGLDLNLAAGWAPTQTVSDPWFYCNPDLPVDPAGALDPNTTQSVLPIRPIGRLPFGLLAYFMPRWCQSCDVRWSFWASDGADAVGILVARPTRWSYPQYHNMYWYTMRWHLMNAWADAAQPGQVFIHSPLDGARWYYIAAGGVEETSQKTTALVSLYAMQELDRLVNTYILDWPGTQPAVGGFAGQFFYDPNTDPTHTIRQQGRNLLAALAKGQPPAPGRNTLSNAQVWCDPDWYAAYQNFMTPENTNFATDFYVLCIGYMMALSVHPNATLWRSIATSVFQMDLFHSVTMPGATSPPAARGGAGQESPGYTGHAFQSWTAEAPLLAQYYGWSPWTQEPRLPAAVDFFYHASTPWAYHFLGPVAADNSKIGNRWLLPLGDTHPNSVNYTQVANLSGIAWPDVTKFVSEEYPGYGVFLRNHAGTTAETMFAFKASPNRGHNHGDQLAFHYSAYGARIAIDIQAGYNPRPYQEYWHNRLAFGMDQNMDAYERLIAFTPSAAVDAAVGQVTSSQLQTLPANPPDIYDGVYPVSMVPAFTYRRAALLVKAPGTSPSDAQRDYIVLVDAHNCSAASAYASLQFFQQDGQVFTQLSSSSADVGNSTLFSFAVASGGVAAPTTFTVDRWNWPSEGNENATRVRINATAAVYFVTLLYPSGSTSAPSESARLRGAAGSLPVPSVSWDPSTATLSVGFLNGNKDVLQFADMLLNATAEVPAAGPATVLASLARNGGAAQTVLQGSDVSLGRSQGSIGMQILDIGYTFGEAPDWVLAQRQLNPTYPWPPNNVLARLNGL